MSFSIQTNVSSLVAQENLNINETFQNKTIQQLTSGYRINQSGDDAAGLAVANTFRNETAGLTQGVGNANDGVAQLQIMDGGMSNIGTMLDRLQTLATQSSSQSFTGDRTVLNNEYQGLVSEIDRQAQSIGLPTSGHFAQNLNIYVGGGQTVAGVASTQNGTVALNLANSAVDSKALGLRTSQFTVSSATGTNLAVASNTSVADIVNANGNAGAATATFDLSGAGFSNMQVSVSLGTSDTTQTVAQKLNTAIQALGNSGTAAGAELRNANIQVAAVTDGSGNETLSFTSANGAFQVSAGSAAANALLGKFAVGGANAATGASVSQTITGGTMTDASTVEAVNLKVMVNGQAVNLGFNTAGNEANAAAMLGDVTGSANYANLTALGVTAQLDNSSTKLQFVGNSNQSIQVEASGDTANYFGMGAWSAEGHTITGNAATNANGQTATVQFSINGGQAIDVNFTSGASLGATATSLQNAINGNSELYGAGLTVSQNGAITIAAGDNAVKFRMNVVSQSGALDLGFGTGAVSTATYSATGQASQLSALGSSQTGLGTANDVFSFAGLTNLGAAQGTAGANADQQVISFSANDANGNQQTASATLSAGNASDVDQAIGAINTALQNSGNSTMQQIVAVKETKADGTAEGIRFISSLNNFAVNVGSAINNSAGNPVGLYDGTAGATSAQGKSVNSSSSGALNIDTVAGALQAVVAVGSAVKQLGTAQAAVGKGENQLNYAIHLANSQITNFSAAQSDLRDANVAQQAANLTKAQVLQQASIAAMAQANSAPQAILTLLRA